MISTKLCCYAECPIAFRQRNWAMATELWQRLIYPGGPEVRVQGGWFQPGTPLKMTFQAVAERAQMDLLPKACS